MAFETAIDRGAMTGARYLDSLKDGREVWLDGQKIDDVTTHPAFRGMVHELSRIYDLQHTEPYCDEMTFVSPDHRKEKIHKSGRRPATDAACRGYCRVLSTT